MTLIEAVRSFHSATSEKPLAANSRSLWLAFICLWNERKRPPLITVSLAELRRLSGIKAKSSLYQSLHNLSSRRLVGVKFCGDMVELRQILDCNAENSKDKALLNIPKTETEGAREAEPVPVIAGLENRTTGKYAGMTLAEMIAARRLERESLTEGATANDGEHTGGNRSREEIAFGTAAKGRASDTGSSDADNGGGFLSAGTQADIQSDVEAVE